MKIVIVYNEPGEGATADELDVLDEVELVAKCLLELGHKPKQLGVTLDLSKTFNFLKEEKPDLVFNLAESIENHGALVHFVPALLDVLNIPYTGNPTVPIFITAGKHLTKMQLQAAGLPVTPTYKPEEAGNLKPGKYIVKPIWEEGSLGLDEESVFEVSLTNPEKITSLSSEKYFIEPYIAGREFNVSMLAKPGGVEVLAVAEIRFVDYPADKPHVLGFRSKWETDSFEYTHTVRTYDLGENGEKIAGKLADISVKCWETLGLRGYARVDFRMDQDGNPWILEVNANPCISPDSGYYAACERVGISFTQAVERIINDTLKK